jgi:hypothetical protein
MSEKVAAVTGELSDKDDDMDWSDNLNGVKDLYEEGQALAAAAAAATADAAPKVAKKDEAPGGGQRPHDGLTAAAGPNTDRGGKSKCTPAAAAAERPPDGLGDGNGDIREKRDEQSISDRAKAFVAKEKEAAADRIREELGEKYLAYAAILAQRKKDLVTPHLLGGKTEQLPDLGSFMSNSDGRILRTHFEVNLGQRRVISYSFDPSTMECRCRSGHSSRKIASGRGEKKTVREAIILADQAYPAALPSATEKLCVNIIRIEHGMLHELGDVLENVLRGRYLEAGSLIMLFSATNLATAGVVGYCADLIGVIERLRRSIGEHVVFTPAPHMFAGGCNSGETVRAAIEVGAWSIHVFGKELCHMKKSFEAANDIVASSGHGGIFPDYLNRYRLPTADRRYTTWVSGGMTELPKMVHPLNAGNEEILVSSIINEIRSGLAIDLDPTPSLERGVGQCSAAAAAGGTLVVGSSNAKRLHKAMLEAGWSAELIYEANFRISKQSVSNLADRVKDSVRAKRPDIIVLQVLDSTVYYSLSEEGLKEPLTKIDARFHAAGDLVLADKHAFAKILAMCKPLLEAAGDCKVVVIGPLPRYVTGGCCSTAEHMPNRANPRFLESLLADLSILNKSLKDFLFSENFRGARAMDPWVGIRDLPATSLWGPDPVHVRQEHFAPLVEGVKLTADKVGNNGNIRKRQNSLAEHGQKRGRTDSSFGFGRTNGGRGDQSRGGRR